MIAMLVGFQNCSGEFSTLASPPSADAHSGKSSGSQMFTMAGSANVCSPSTLKLCQSGNGTGSQGCNSAGSAWGICQNLLRCNTGYTLANGTCSPIRSGAPMNRIGTKVINAQGAFFETATGSLFIPRGQNYIRLAASGHAVFEPGLYSPQNVESALEYMRGSGYNYVRVFLADSNSINSGFGLSSPGISDAYLNNVADFIFRAANNGIRIMLTGGAVPSNYISIVSSYPSQTSFQFQDGEPVSNAFLMHPGWAHAHAQFLSDLLNGLKARNPVLLSAIFSIDIENEATFNTTTLPLSLHSGSVTINGVSYDMSNMTDRQQMMNASAVQWFLTVRNAIKAVDPQILVSASVFPPYPIGRVGFDGADWHDTAFPYPWSDKTRMPVDPMPLLVFGQADYLDIHNYWDLDADLSSVGLSKQTILSKPIIIGEYGALRSSYSTASSAGTAMNSYMQSSCSYGFTGWGYWTWDTDEQVDSSGLTQFWNTVDSGGAVNGAIAPLAWPTVCSPIPAGDFIVGQTIFHSNGVHFCGFDSWAHFIAIEGSVNISAFPTYSRIPITMIDDGICQP